MHTDLTKGKIKKHLVTLSIPAVTGYFFHTMFNVTDTIFAGFISTQALAALSLSASVFFMILAIGIGMSEAVTSLVGNALGEKNELKAKNIAFHAIVFSLILSVCLSLFGVLSVPYLVAFLGDASYVTETLDYMNLILYGAVFFMIVFFVNALLNSVGDTKSLRNALIFTTFLNIALDYLFVMHFNMNVKGIAFATVISELVTMLYLIYKLKKTKLWLCIKDFTYDVNIMKAILKQGLPPSVNMFMMAFGMYIITYFVASFGKEAVAAFGIAMRIEQMFLMPIVGLNIAVLTIIAQNNGAKAYERIEPTLRLGIGYGWVISTIGVSAFLLFAEYFAALMTSDVLVIEQTALYLRVCGVASYAFVVIFIYIAMLQGIAKPAMIVPVSIYRQIIAPVLVFSLLVWFGFGILSLWIGLDLIIFSSALFLWWYGEKKLKGLKD